MKKLPNPTCGTLFQRHDAEKGIYYIFHVVIVDYDVAFDVALTERRCSLEWIRHPATKRRVIPYDPVAALKIRGTTAVSYALLHLMDNRKVHNAMCKVFGIELEKAKRLAKEQWDADEALSRSV